MKRPDGGAQLSATLLNSPQVLSGKGLPVTLRGRQVIDRYKQSIYIIIFKW